jgi:hypothetical protein
MKADDVTSGSGNNLIDRGASVRVIQAADIPTKDVEGGV